MLLGSQHTVTKQYSKFRDILIEQEKRLERVVPRDTVNAYIVPALLARVTQLEHNNWLYYQMRTAGIVPMTTLIDVFNEIDRERHWEPTFPSRYLLGSKPRGTPYPAEISLSGTQITDESTLSWSVVPVTVEGPTDVPGEPKKTSNQIRNTQYNEEVFGTFKAQGIKSAKLRESLKARNVSLPRNAKKERLCLPFHVLGICNTRCGNAADHVAHTPAEDQALLTWCQANYKLE